MLLSKRNSRKAKGTSHAGRALLFGLLSGEPHFKTLVKAASVVNECGDNNFTILDSNCFEFTDGIDPGWESNEAISTTCTEGSYAYKPISLSGAINTLLIVSDYQNADS